MPDTAAELAVHDERIKQNRRDIDRNAEDIKDVEEDVSTIKVKDEGRDTRIEQLQWFVLLIATAIAALAFAVLRQGVVR